jgi:[citrate (pro-3S)-lyase] ligase
LNANPFVLGHQFYVESAATRIDHLFILVAEDNRSMFPFSLEQRFALLFREGTRHLANVSLTCGGLLRGVIHHVSRVLRL